MLMFFVIFFVMFVPFFIFVLICIFYTLPFTYNIFFFPHFAAATATAQQQRWQQQSWHCVRQAAVVDLPIKSYIHGFSSLINTVLRTYGALLCTLKPVFGLKKNSFIVFVAICCKLGDVCSYTQL